MTRAAKSVTGRLAKGVRTVLYGERPATSASPGLSELLGYQALVGDGVVLLKDRFGGDDGGALLAGWWYRGPDLESASAEAIAALSQSVNGALKKLDTGWMLHVEAIRIARAIYERGNFEEAVDALIDEEREANAVHYTTECALFLTYEPGVLERAGGRKLRDFFLGTRAEELLESLESRVERFERKLDEMEAALGSALILTRMRSHPLNDELLQALNLVVNGQWKPCRSPRRPVDLSCLLARDLVWSEAEMQHGEDYVEVVGLLDLPACSVPGLLHSLTQVDAEVRWSSRFIMMDYGGTRSQLKSLEAKWTHKLVPFTSQLLGTPGAEDRDAAERVDEVHEALADLESGAVRYGHYTSVVVVRAPTAQGARDKAALVLSELERRGFMALVEQYNRAEAWLGSLPGHGVQNVRRPLVHTLNFADLLPLGREWPGSRVCPSPMFPAESPALLQARSWSGSPYFFNVHYGDLGHTVVLGPSGAGKSTFDAMIVSQWLRYPRSQVFVFDQGCSMAALTLARRDGAFFRLGGEAAPKLCPLAGIGDEASLAWAAEWLESLCEAQGLRLSPRQRERIYMAVCELEASTRDWDDKARGRTLTHFLPHLVDSELETALRYYTTGPAGRILNGDTNEIACARVTTFELEELLDAGDKTVRPTLMYLFREVEQRLDGRPTLLVIDEAWRQLDDPIFSEKLRAWLKKLRKRNCAVVLATQQLSDIANSSIRDVVFESCATRVLLPNELATGTMRALYSECLNLSSDQIELLAQLERKRWYLHVVGNRSRAFSLDLGPIARAFCGASSPAELSALWRLVEEHGESWPAAWLRERGEHGAATRLEELELERAARAVQAMRERARLAARKVG